MNIHNINQPKRKLRVNWSIELQKDIENYVINLTCLEELKWNK